MKLKRVYFSKKDFKDSIKLSYHLENYDALYFVFLESGLDSLTANCEAYSIVMNWRL